MVKTLPKQTGKMYLDFDSSMKKRFSILVYPLILSH